MLRPTIPVNNSGSRAGIHVMHPPTPCLRRDPPRHLVKGVGREQDLSVVQPDQLRCIHHSSAPWVSILGTIIFARTSGKDLAALTSVALNCCWNQG